MTQVNTDGLPPEMQERIAQIIEGAKQKANAAATAAPSPSFAESPHQAAIAPPTSAPPVRQPSLMDHTIALRQEVAAMRQEMQALGQVVDAVGQAVGQLYATFQATTAPTNYGAAYEAHQSLEEGDY